MTRNYFLLVFFFLFMFSVDILRAQKRENTLIKGQQAPDFELTFLGKNTSVKLSELQKEKPVVLFFGSYTCPKFRNEVKPIQKVFQKYQNEVEFFLVYIKEAHPIGLWKKREEEEVLLPQHTSKEDREKAATKLVQDYQLKIPVLIADMEDVVENNYVAYPTNIVLLDKQRKIVFTKGRAKDLPDYLNVLLKNDGLYSSQAFVKRNIDSSFGEIQTPQALLLNATKEDKAMLESLQNLEGLKLALLGKKFLLKKGGFYFNYSIEDHFATGLLIKPLRKPPYPVIIINHGAKQSAKYFCTRNIMTFLLSGYVVLACDLNYGKGKETTFKNTFGVEKDQIKSIKAAINILKKLPFVDANRIFLYGDKEGAYSTIAACCAQIPEIKAAAITSGGVFKANHTLLAAELKKVQTPILILHGTANQEISVSMAQELKNLLESQQKVVEIKLYEGINHELIRKTNHKVFAEIRKFFLKYSK